MWGSDGEFVIDGNLKSVEYLDKLSSIHVPTLLICGDHDESNPSLSRTMHEKLRDQSWRSCHSQGTWRLLISRIFTSRPVSDFLKGK
jgi:pimeloyl-ACP methyl ester carboxylesterase